MNRYFQHVALCLLIGLVMASESNAQRVRFGLYAGDGLQLVKGNVTELNFNLARAVIIPGTTGVTIQKTHEGSAVIAVNGRSDLDVTVSVDADPSLVLDVHEIPLTIRFAYYNLAVNPQGLSEQFIRENSIEIPVGFNNATFPVLRRQSGPPGPPPTPGYQGIVQPQGTAFLVIFGSLGRVPDNAASGIYGGEINISVEYSTYE